MIDFTLLGTSALIPLPDRFETAALLECAGHSILFDCGEATQTAAHKAEVSLIKTDMIALTHYHGDHIFGLPGLLQTMTSMGRTKPLYITGPDGLREVMALILQLVGWTSYEIQLFDMPETQLRLCDMMPGWPAEARLSAFRTEHRIPSQGYSFTLGRAGKFVPQKAKELGIPTNQWGLLQKGISVQVGETIIMPEQVLGEPRKGLKVVFSGDTALCDTLISAAADANLLVCEGTYGDTAQGAAALERGHMTFAQAAEAASRAGGVQELWLAHYTQAMAEPAVYLPEATTIFSNTVYGQDGMKKTLHFAD